jgi:hypothetical protein
MGTMAVTNRYYAVVLLGAGASADAGIPTSKALLRSYVDTLAPAELADAAALVSRATNGEQIGELANVEELAFILERHDPEAYHRLHDFVMNAILSAQHGPNYQPGYLAPLSGALFDLMLGSMQYHHIATREDAPLFTSPRLFTLNYDTTVEDACQNKWLLLDLFDTSEPPPYRMLTEHELAERRRTHSSGSMTDPWWVTGGLVKLHGSLDWHRDDSQAVFRDAPSTAHPPEVIFGTQRKATLRYPFGGLFHEFAQSLQGARLLVTIGYGWSDEHLNEIIRDHAIDGMAIFDLRPGETLARPKAVQRADVPVLRIKATTRDALEMKPVPYGILGKGWLGVARIDKILYDNDLLNRRKSRRWAVGIVRK